MFDSARKPASRHRGSFSFEGIRMTVYVMNEEPLSEKHVAWMTTTTEDKIRLIEIVEAKYKHPVEPDYAFVYQLEVRHRGEERRSTMKAASWILLEASGRAVEQVERLKEMVT